MPKSQRQLLPVMLLTLALLPILTACAHPTGTAAINAAVANPPPSSVCAVFKIIMFDRLKDTEATIQQVKDSNARRDALCGPTMPATALPTPPTKTSAPDRSPPVQRFEMDGPVVLTS